MNTRPPKYRRDRWTTGEAGKLLDLGTGTISKQCDRGVIEASIMPGVSKRHRRIHSSELARWCREAGREVPVELLTTHDVLIIGADDGAVMALKMEFPGVNIHRVDDLFGLGMALAERKWDAYVFDPRMVQMGGKLEEHGCRPVLEMQRPGQPGDLAGVVECLRELL